MQALRMPEFGRAIVTALLTVTIASSAMATRCVTKRFIRDIDEFKDPLNKAVAAKVEL